MKYAAMLACLFLLGCTEDSTEVRITQGTRVWEVCRGEAKVSTGGGEIAFTYEGHRILLSGNWTEEEIGSCSYQD
jgi:hypothetical protein